MSSAGTPRAEHKRAEYKLEEHKRAECKLEEHKRAEHSRAECKLEEHKRAENKRAEHNNPLRKENDLNEYLGITHIQRTNRRIRAPISSSLPS